MFERFSADARAVVVDAQTAARRRGAPSIDTVHLLLALAEQPGTRAVRALTDLGIAPSAVERLAEPSAGGDVLDDQALAAIGIDLATVRARTDAAFGDGALDRVADRPRRGHVPFTHDAKRTLELALREAIHEGSRSIDSGHVLLALLRADGTSARRVLDSALRDAGTDAGALRDALHDPRRTAS